MRIRTVPHWRPDVQGLRAVAVLAVVAFHAGLPFAQGGFVGVDVFFVISGFLITGNLVREHEADGRISIGRFFRRRLVRLAPAGVATVAVTLLVARAVLPPLDRTSLRFDAWAALLGVENIRLARLGTDYLAPHTEGPFNQFWSLGVEEQFYLAWALVLAAVLGVRPLRRHVLLVVAGLTAAGFAIMLVVAAVSGPWAFFSPVSRCWELGVGAAVAAWSARRQRGARKHRDRSRRPLGSLACLAPVLGFLAIAWSTTTFDARTPFPDFPTLAPVLGAALLVMPTASPVRRLLTARPLQWIGDRSYSIYLWHWPCLVLPTLALERPLRPGEAAVALVATAVLSWASHTALERGLGTWARRGPLRPVTVAGMAAVVAVAVAPLTALPVLHGTVRVPPPTDAQVRSGPWSPHEVPTNLSPSLAAADDDLPDVYGNGCHVGFAAVRSPDCTTGRGDRSVVLFGDSHAAQWVTPLRSLTSRQGADLRTLTKSSCPSASLDVWSAELSRGYHECGTWREDAIARINAERPAVVVLSNAANRYRTDADAAGWGRAMRETIERLRPSGAEIVVLGDTPSWSTDPNRCLSGSVEDVRHCATDAARLVSADRAAAQRQAAEATGATYVDPVPWLCGTDCSPVLWNVLVYRDTNHLTDEMARTLRPRLETALGHLLDEPAGARQTPSASATGGV